MTWSPTERTQVEDIEKKTLSVFAQLSSESVGRKIKNHLILTGQYIKETEQE